MNLNPAWVESESQPLLCSKRVLLEDILDGKYRLHLNVVKSLKIGSERHRLWESLGALKNKLHEKKKEKSFAQLMQADSPCLH